MNKNLRVAGLATVAASLVFTMGACGGQTNSPAASKSSNHPSSAAASSQAAKPTKLTIALVPSQNADKIMGTSKPLTDYLTKELGIPVEAKVTQDYTGAVEALGADQAQLAFLPVLPMQQAVERKGAVPLLQVVRNGSTTYHAEFITNDPSKYCKDTPVAGGDKGYLYCNGTATAKKGPVAIERVKDLKGQKVAFVEETSASGYIFPMLALMNQGLKKSDVTPVFAGGHDKSVLAVYNNQAPVGACFDDARLNVKDKADVGQKVVVFAFSEEIPNDGIVAAKSVSKEYQDKISAALIAFSKSDSGKQTLKDLYGITNFDKANPDALKIVKEAAEKVVGSR